MPLTVKDVCPDIISDLLKKCKTYESKNNKEVPPGWYIEIDNLSHIKDLPVKIELDEERIKGILETLIIKSLKSCIITGRLEYHTFPPPEYFAKEMSYPLAQTLKAKQDEIIKKI